MPSPVRSRNPLPHKERADWRRAHFRRLLVDMHIPDWDERMLSLLDPKTYVETVARGHGGAIMLYCNSHVGLALYPSRVGPVHRGIGSGDFVGDVLARAHKKGLAVVAYYSAVFNNAAFLGHSDWRIVPPQGDSLYKETRYGACCPNSPYRDFAVAQTEEICRAYPFEGIFFDMLFWPYPCYCRHCAARFQKEAGRPLPRIVDWNDPVWVKFQRARERWMSELAGALTAAVRRTRPAMTATHQTGPVLLDWRGAMPYSILDHCDYATGDFYGSPVQQSVVCKIFNAISRHRPFEMMTSRCTDLRDHVTTKPESQLEMHAFLAPAHAAAFMFIDAIDPVGTLNRPVYDRIASVFRKMEPYEKFLGGTLAADVAIYVSSESRFDERENGRDAGSFVLRSDNMASEFAGQHMTAVMGAAQSLQESHIPYAVVTRRNLDGLKKYRVLVLPNVLAMSDAEIRAVRRYVKEGGVVYASGNTSLLSETGPARDNFGLADVLGVSALGRMEYSLVFIAPSDRKMKRVIAPQEHLIHKGGCVPVRARRTARVLAAIHHPWYPENEGTVLEPSFSSIHSTPPALDPAGPAITWNRFGKGRACYSAAPLEAEGQGINRLFFARLIRDLLGRPLPVEADAPSFVEITAFEKPEERRLNLSLISLRQKEEPVPCAGLVRVRPGKKRRVAAVRMLPGRKRVPIRAIPGGIEFAFRDFETFALFELEYSNRKPRP